VKCASVFQEISLSESFFSDGIAMISTLEAILAATLICGTLDAIAASAQAAALGIPPHRVWQTVASGLLGTRALEVQWSGALGIVLHFFISLVISTIYVLASQHLPFLLRHPLIAGAFYGIAVYLVMNYIVIPLSRRAKRPFNRRFAATQLLIHTFVVGWSIAIAASYLLPSPVQ
jgi:hypothetical protein